MIKHNKEASRYASLFVIYIKQLLAWDIPFYLSTCYFCASTSRGRGCEVIGQLMHNYCTPNNLKQSESVCVKCHEGVSVVLKKWRKVSCMLRMGASVRVVVHSYVSKRIFLVA